MQESMIILLLTLLAAFYDEAVALYFFITTKSFIKNSLKTKAKVADVEQVKIGKDLPVLAPKNPPTSGENFIF